ncbi:hypothetical protein AAFP35_25790 [Gordonia sp. CPCC 206044]|uniref:hypothetical protein n=1 Tax=Gordonia sp. CPCC 206044 TaxID=3140793 RepID=UPI003AF3FDC2
MRQKNIRRLTASGLAAAAIVSGSVLGAGTSSATTLNSWIGPLRAENIDYLHYSTITNAPNLEASTRIYTVDGNPVQPFTIGARARLFKSGALCQATNYVFNEDPSTQVVAATSGHCGTGSYNSHGFVEAWNGTGYTEIFTFPTNPLNYTAPAARSVEPATSAKQSGKNSQGKSFGTAEGVRDDAQLPDLISTYATNGKLGYVYANAPTKKPATRAAARVAQQQWTVPVYEQDGTTQIGVFTVG